MKKISLCFVGMEGGGMSGIGQMGDGIFKSVFGIGQMIAGGVQKAKAKKLMPGETDPSQVATIDTLRNMRRSYATGSEAQTYKNDINQGLATNANAIVRLSGGNTGGAMSAMAQSGANAGEAYGNMAANLEKNKMGALALENAAIKDVSQRRMDIKMAKYLQMMTQAMSNLKAGQQNWLAGHEEFGQGIESFMSGGMSGGKQTKSSGQQAAGGGMADVSGGAATAGASAGAVGGGAKKIGAAAGF